MSKMSNLDQLFRDIGDDVIGNQNKKYNCEYVFKENYNGYTYFWEKRLKDNLVFDESQTKITEFEEITEQFALLIDFTGSEYKCLHKGWEVHWTDKASDPYNEYENTVQSNDFETFLEQLLNYLWYNDNDGEGFSILSQPSLAFQLEKLKNQIKEGE